MPPQLSPKAGDALEMLSSSTSTDHMIQSFVHALSGPPEAPSAPDQHDPGDILQVGIAALDAFLQANVTGPVLPPATVADIERRFIQASTELQGSPSSPSVLQSLRSRCLEHLDVDGVAPYAHIPHLELFGLARHIIGNVLPTQSKATVVTVPSPGDDAGTTKYSLTWMRLRVNAWHYKLLTQPTLGHGSNFTRSSQWSDVPTLAARIFDGIDAVSRQILGEEVWASGSDEWSRHDRALFLIEAANYYILLGRSDLARNSLQKAAQTNRLQYALSGALGKRTRFQEKSTSQLTVLAKSGGEADKGDDASAGNDEEGAKPDALKLNHDTLLEDIHFTKDKDADQSADPSEHLPPALAELAPDDQPQLNPLDQIILLTEATMKDAFSPIDSLTSEEILPYAVRVLADKSTNWQIYTQALLVRSRIELHRSKTLERGVLQLQAVADQIIADTTAADATDKVEKKPTPDVPDIQVSLPDQNPETDTTKATVDKPTTFLPAPKPSESAPAHVRLRYIHALSAPPRWHLESELAYAWASVGSLASAVDIFKRLRLWAEVALCLASIDAAGDEDGRGRGGEEKARAIIRWQLFHRTGTTEQDSHADDNVGDVTALRSDDWMGSERDPPPPNASRLWCILGDIEASPAHYERAWEISRYRYARAQRSLAEHYVQRRDWSRARDAFKLATAVNRLNPDMWSRLGDVCLGLGDFEEAAEAYSRAIGSATDTAGGEGAKTWSNLGTALWSLYREVAAAARNKEAEPKTPAPAPVPADDEEDDVANIKALNLEKTVTRDPAQLLAQALSAFKRGATIAHDNWRIWDNVLTLSAHVRPPSVPDMVLAMRNILRIRATEDAIDADVLSALVQDAVLSKDTGSGTDIYELPRGSHERLVVRLVEEEVTPVITRRSELWALVARLRAWMRDYAGAIDASERAWRAVMGASSGGLLSTDGAAAADWTSDKDAWDAVVLRTDELASMLENWGPGVDAIGPKWKGRVRSAVRSVMGRGRENFEGSDGWKTLEGIMEGLKT